MKENMIQCEDLYYEYIKEDGESKIALDGLNLEVKQGEFLVILGHNGSGKSTLAKHFNALHIPSSGNILVDNLNTREEENLWDIRKRVGMVFQNPDNQIVATIVEEDVAFGPENLGVEPSEIRKRVDEALKQVHMYEYRKHGPHLLSGGQKQRIAIAGILAMKTKCIVLDEPTAMLDPFGRKEVLNTMLELNKNFGITIVLITHFMEEAVNADRVIVLDKGNIINEGTPREIFSKVKIMKEIGLDVPQVTELAYELQKEGINISTDIINIDEMVDTLCQLK
ncbi:energy-coupling factor transport system ATP-binding protein [Clostridium collagenovorans DSM 3089]|uniref:Energy-coupling factor transport system ATP-binding protein n=1 Tax=Clostridium collagenovorans DSM 3089 TaxID=1121306 RepID=A0A1M5W9U4_9CLOT|nr:energy-coupling factor transporter ATPase [Clostridium collagenovorans]SHH84349.1 energy-coupling factor transport system ATP-binding protein [Clostridium collagenovorans DSM 3089]